MEAILLLISIAFAIWAIRCICLNKQSAIKKLLKSLFALWYFLVAGAIGATPEYQLISIFMIMTGVSAIYYINRQKSKKLVSNEDIFREHKEALEAHEIEEAILKIETDEADVEYRQRILKSQRRKSGLKPSPSQKLSQQLLKKIAFLYINAKGERKFREVDVISYDGFYLKGYCYLAREVRTFILDRIDGAIIIRETGEAVEPYEWADMLGFS